MPKPLQYDSNDPNRGTMSAFLFSLQISLHQELFLNNFLLDRLPDGGSRQVKQDLVNTARKMLDGVLVLGANRDRLADYTIHIVWAVSPFLCLHQKGTAK